METKELHEAYDAYVQSMFDDKFKKDLLDIVAETYGEEFRSKFETNMGKIIVHAKFNINRLKDMKRQNVNDYLPLNRDVQELEDKLLEELEKTEKEVLEAKLKAQKELLRKLKSDLDPKSAEELQSIIDNYNTDDFFHFAGDKSNEQTQLEITMAKLMNGLNLEVLIDLIQKYELNKLGPSSEHQNPAIQQYIEELKTIEEYNIANTKRFSNYNEINDEMQNVDLEDFDILSEVGKMIRAGGEVALNNKETGQSEYHIFVCPYNKKDILRGKITHEVLHALENTEKEINGQTRIRTGFNEYDDSNRYTRTSECIHTLILDTRIFRALQKMGYEIGDNSDYRLDIEMPMQDFYDAYETQILRSRCQDDLSELYSVVGRDNFERFIDTQTDRDFDKQAAVVNSMKEYSRSNMTNRIGKYTLGMQENVRAKSAVTNELTALLELERGELTNAD